MFISWFLMWWGKSKANIQEQGYAFYGKNYHFYFFVLNLPFLHTKITDKSKK